MSGTNFPMPKRYPEQTGSAPADSSPKNKLKFSRRHFGRNAAAMAAWVASPASLLAVTRASATDLTTRTEPEGHASAEENARLGITPQQAAEVDAKLANIIRKFGERLSDEQRLHLRRILAYNERMLAGVRAFALENGDPPASVLRVFPMREPATGVVRRGGAWSKPAPAGKKRKGAH
jgi:hypothetical protein